MIHIIESFAVGLAFGMGVTAWFGIQQMATAKGRKELSRQFNESRLLIEKRMEVQIATMAACLEEIKKNRN